MTNAINLFVSQAVSLEQSQIMIELQARKAARVVSINKPLMDIAEREFLAISRLTEDELQALFPLVAYSETAFPIYAGLNTACERIATSLDLWLQQGMPTHSAI